MVNDIVDLINNKESLLGYLNQMVMSSEKNAAGLRSMKERGFSDAGMLEKVIEVTAIQSDQIGNLAIIALFIVQGGDWDKNVAEVMMRMGRGKEALQAMFNAKLKRG
jgi:hypothetical protein